MTKTPIPFAMAKSMCMFEDDHFQTEADYGAIATQKNPKKGIIGTLENSARVAYVGLIFAVSTRLREKALSSSIKRLIERMNIFSKKPSIVFLDEGHSSFSIIKVLKTENMFVFVTARDFEAWKRCFPV